MAGGVKFAMRIEFFRDFDPKGEHPTQEEYAGSVLIDEVEAVCLPRVGERINMTYQWMPYVNIAVAIVEHGLAGKASYRGHDADGAARATVVVQTGAPVGNNREVMLSDVEEQGWTFSPSADERAAERDPEGG